MLISVDFRNIFGATSLSGRRESGGGRGVGEWKVLCLLVLQEECTEIDKGKCRLCGI